MFPSLLPAILTLTVDLDVSHLFSVPDEIRRIYKKLNY